MSEEQHDHAPATRLTAVSGVMWSSVASVGRQVTSFAVTVVLARLLGPTAFGLVAMIAVFTGFLTVFVDSGMAGALIQRKRIDERHLSSTFWINVAAGTVLMLLLIGLSPILAIFYHQPRLVPLSSVVSVDFLITSLAIVHLALLQRTMNFRRLAFVQNTAAIVAGVVGITTAFIGFGVWSLIMQTLVLSVVTTVFAWRSTNWRPRFVLDLPALRELWGFSANLAGFNALNYWSRNADNLLIGKFVGPAGLGTYDRAYTAMLLPSSQVTTVVTQVMFPAMARIQDDKVRVKQSYLRMTSLVALLSFPAAAGLLVMAKPFVLTLLGERWTAVIPILQILSVPALAQSVGGTTGLIYQACGRTNWLLRWGIVSSILTLVAFGAGIPWGVLGVATAYSIRTLVLLYPNYAIPGKLIDMRFREVVASVREVLIASGVMAACVWGMSFAISNQLPAPAILATEAAAGLLVYIGALRILRPPAADDFLALLRERMGRVTTLGSQQDEQQPTPETRDA